jgi:UDP-N-acetylmuramate: L-alanyl-gamma-D-glutamyl-meso-diaminopimelate ligase
LPSLDKETVKKHFSRADLEITDEKETLEDEVKRSLKQSTKPVCLLLMSSGTFEGIDWNTVSSH